MQLHRIQYIFHFLQVTIETHSPRIVTWLQESGFASYQQSGASPLSSQYRVLIEEMDSAYAHDIAPLENGILSPIIFGYGPCYYQDGYFYSQVNDEFSHKISFNLQDQTLYANLGGRYLHSEEDFIYFLRPLFRNALFLFQCLKTLHGAVVCRDEKTLFLAGEKGRGKTTLALWLVLHQGYQLLSDDSPFFTVDDNRASAFSSLDEPRITEATLALMPQLQAYITKPPDIAGKYAINRTLFGQSHLRMGPEQITHYIELDRGDYPSILLEPLDKYEVFSRLIKESMILVPEPLAEPFSSISRWIFNLLTQLLQNAQMFRLCYNNDQLDAVAALIEGELSNGE
jgi:hypothetical protein